ncbi:MAG: hypothetical protein WBC95_08395 [Albidovulum sp.]
MQRRFSGFAGALCALTTGLPLTATAQSMPENVTISGDVEIQYLSSDTNDTTLLFGDVDLSFAPVSGGTGLGFDAGLLAYDDSDTFGVSEAALFAAVTYTTSYGKFSFGIPRSAASDFVRMPDVGGNRLIGLEQRVISGSVTEFLYLLGDETPVGLRYDGDYGALKTALSYHRIDDVNVYDLALSYEAGAFFATGSVERVTGLGSNATLVHAEIGASTDFYEAGLGYTDDGDVFIDSAFMAWASIRPMDQLGLTATILDVKNSDTVYGLSGKYGFWNGAYAQLGVIDSSGFDPIWDVALGYHF